MGRRVYDIDGLVQDCSNSSALAVELLQSCTKPSICRSPQSVGGIRNGDTAVLR